MNARVLFATLGITGAAIGLGQLSSAVAENEDTSATIRSSPGLTPQTNLTDGRGGITADGPEQSQSNLPSSGADIKYSGIYQAMNHSPVGNTYAYSLGSYTCNLGDTHLIWQNNGSPGFASNAYRLHNGRLMQIGTGWVKHACCVVNANNPSVCGGLTCQSTGEPGLRPGCLDTYSASWNSNQTRLGPRVNINPFTGQFASLSGGGSNSIDRRLQIHRNDMLLSNYPGALYFVEGVYVCTSSSQAGNMNNNATHRRATFNQSNFNISLQPEEHVGQPAIFAWQNHGQGVNTPDSEVKIHTLDLPGEGRLFAGSRISDNGDGTWRYEYAVYNLNSHQAAGAFSVGIGSGVNVSNVGFHSPTYHSGAPQDNTPWQHAITADAVTWSTTQTYAQNPQANAIRWGSMYNFWFDADQPPVLMDGDIDVFIPGTADGVSFTLRGPGDAPITCPADLNDDGVVDGLDLLVLLGNWGSCDNCNDCTADLNNDCIVDGLDLLLLLADWGECP
jgi:hypothetical protein